MHSAEVFKLLIWARGWTLDTWGSRGDWRMMGSSGILQHPPPRHRFWHWVRNGLVGLDPQKVWPDVASWWEEACESHSFDHMGPSPPILSSTKLWKQKAFHHPFSSKPDLMWGFLRLCKQSHVVWMFCYSYIVLSDGVVPQSPRGVLCYPHMHYLTDLKFETCEPWNQWAPRVWIKIVGL